MTSNSSRDICCSCLPNNATISLEFLKMDFDSLSLEIKYKIFSLLTDTELQSVALVSKQWYKVAQDPFFRKNLEMNEKNLRHINYFIQKYRRLRSIEIDGLDCEPWVNSLPENFHLRKLLLCYCHFKSTGTLSKLFKRIPCLYEFHFFDCTFDEFDCPTSIEDCKLLKRLFIGYHKSYKQNHTCMDILLQKCSNIEQLEMACDCVSDLTFKTENFTQNPNLKILYLDCKSLSENSYPKLGNYHQMTKLSLLPVHQLTNTGLLAIKKLQHLQSLEIGRSSTNADFVHLFEGVSFDQMKSLWLFELPSVHNYVIQLIGESCPALCEFTLIECFHNLDNGFCVLIRKCIYLEKLILIDLSLTTGNFLKEIPNNVPNLRHIEVTGCDLLSLRDLSRLKTKRPKIFIEDPDGHNVELSCVHECHSANIFI